MRKMSRLARFGKGTMFAGATVRIVPAPRCEKNGVVPSRLATCSPTGQASPANSVGYRHIPSIMPPEREGTGNKEMEDQTASGFSSLASCLPRSCTQIQKHGMHDTLDIFHFAMHRSPPYATTTIPSFPNAISLHRMAQTHVADDSIHRFSCPPRDHGSSQEARQISLTSDLAPAKPRRPRESQRDPASDAGGRRVPGDRLAITR